MKDFLKIGDSEYRVEANWNAIAGFCRKKGVSDLSQLDVLVHIAIDDILPLMHCCIKEGERLEKRNFPMSESELGSVVNLCKAEPDGGGWREWKKKVNEIVSLDYFLGIALGELDMQVMEFWEMRLKDFFLKLHYYNEKKQRELEVYANLLRMQTVSLINVQLDKKSRITDPKKFWLFPWEIESVQESGVQDIGNVIKLSKLL